MKSFLIFILHQILLVIKIKQGMKNMCDTQKMQTKFLLENMKWKTTWDWHASLDNIKIDHNQIASEALGSHEQNDEPLGSKEITRTSCITINFRRRVLIHRVSSHMHMQYSMTKSEPMFLQTFYSLVSSTSCTQYYSYQKQNQA
jgi:hypothetical protein